MNSISSSVRKVLLAKKQQRQMATMFLRYAQQHQRSYFTPLKPKQDAPDDPNFYNDPEFLSEQESERGKLVAQVPKREMILAKIAGCMGALWLMFMWRDEGAIVLGLEPFHHEHAHGDAESDADDVDLTVPQQDVVRTEAQLEYYLKFARENPSSQEQKIRFFKHM